MKGKIIQINKDLFKLGHSLTPKSDLDLKDYNCALDLHINDPSNCHFIFKTGVQVGDKFWMMQIKTIACK